jgi:hypothetical protein
MKDYFDLDLHVLRDAVGWSRTEVQNALAIFEKYLPNDLRPREAYAGAIDFRESGKRTNRLRKLAMDAYKASRETKLPQASYSANAASLLAALAYTHPFRDKNQARHVLGPVVYSALAIEAENGDRAMGEGLIDQSIAHCPAGVVKLLREFPRQELGKNRVDELFYRLDQGLSVLVFPERST